MTRLPRPRTFLFVEAALLVIAVAITLPEPGAIPLALFGIPILVYGWLGTRIAERAPENRIGWLLSGAALTAAAAFAAIAYQRFGIGHSTRSLPLADVVHLLVVVVPVPVIGFCFLLVFLSFPNGRLPSVRWRPVVWLGVTVAALVAVVSLRDTELVEAGLSPAWARAGPFQEPFTDVVVALAAAVFLLMVASLFARARRVPVEERRPVRGLLITLLLMAAAIPPVIVFGQSDGTWIIAFITSLVFLLGFLVGIPFSLSVAMLRYGLFDYEVGVRKTIARRVLVGAIMLMVGLVGLILVLAFLGSILTGTEGRRVSPVIAVSVGIGVGVLLMLVGRWTRRYADRVVFGERETPYEILAQFSGRVAETYSLDDVLPRMAVLLAKGTGAAEARIWLEIDGELRPIAAFPEEAMAADPIVRVGDDLATADPSRRVFAVQHQGSLLGVLDLMMPANDPMNAQKEQLVRDVAGQAGLVLRNVGLLEDVRESRRRIVAAQDERARALERNIHDGAQQQLVALTVKLRLAEQLAERDPAGMPELLRTLQVEATDALEDLRDLARGIYPPLLADQGLGAALQAQARKSLVPVAFEIGGIGRYSQEIESAVYFSCLEALQNVTKYAEASEVRITLGHDDGRLSLEISDNGVGFDPAATTYGTGLQGIADRLDALGGAFEVVSAVGEGTVLNGSVPVA
ncbi:MAG: sensor histidine kinase [Actinomycetota bacterium]